MEKASLDTRSATENAAYIIATVKDAYERKAAIENADALKGLERFIMLNAVDRLWQEHLYAMDGLREAVYLRAFAQKDPLVEYKNEAFDMFTELMENIRGEILSNLFRGTTNLQAFDKFLGSLPFNLLHQDPEAMAAKPASAEPEGAEPPAKIELPFKREMPKAGRNDPCPCGSGKKFKNCCGRTA